MNWTPEELSDRAQIIELTHRYAWALDTKQFDQLDTVFAEDARADLLRPEHFVGREAIKTRISGAIRHLDATQHLVANHVVVLNGDRATCKCYLQGQHVNRSVASGSPNFIMAGHYEDDVVRTPDGWRIAFRKLTITWTEGNPEATRKPG